MAYTTDCYGPESRVVEIPILDFLTKDFGYTYLKPSLHAESREGENNVILKDIFINAMMRINEIDEDTANSIYQDMLNLSDNQKWLERLRGDNYSKSVPDQKDDKTIRLIDLIDPKNNDWTVTNQFKVKSERSRIPDVVVFINGIPVVVIEAKSPFSSKNKIGEAFDQIMQYENDIPRLFQSNVFNIVTDEQRTLYGATGSPAKFWGYWRCPWPMTKEDFGGDELKMALWCLLDKKRLLDLISHFVVFEREEDEDGRTRIVKKVCRYQQYRAVNKIFDRVVKDEQNKGLVWHTQGSGKSLTMVFSALKLKMHRTIEDKNYSKPNIIVLTDRIDLDTQIARTFKACGVTNVDHISTVADLHSKARVDTLGLTLISTIFKFQGSKKAVPNSKNWIVLVDECHRTQEKDLAAFLRMTFPDAKFFGFTGTPVKSNDLNTYQNFSPEGEAYIDRYDIDDAVADGATVPIHYTGRKAEWHLDAKKLDILFDNKFADLDEDKLNEVKEKGVKLADIVKHKERVETLAFDIWSHFKETALPDGLKAQIVAYDREAVILYKRALNDVLQKHFMKKEGLSEDEAYKKADSYSACVYSNNQEDAKPSENEYTSEIRKDLQKHFLDKDAEKEVKKRFKTVGSAPYFLIVCNKLLTGFDAPIEGVMYLDNPLTQHNLLQAIARTNRVFNGGKKHKGLIVDYIGVSKKLDEALSSYRKEDIQNALKDIGQIAEDLKNSHHEVMLMMRGIDLKAPNKRAEFIKLKDNLETIDTWYIYKKRAKAFIRDYENLSPEPEVLQYQNDLKWIVSFLQWGTLEFEKKKAPGLEDYSEKIREMLEDHLEVTGIKTICKLRHLTDPEFYNDFDTTGKSEEDLREAATRKVTELQEITKQKTEENELRYSKFSERVKDLLARLESGESSIEEILSDSEKLSKDIQAEENAYKKSGLTVQEYDVLKIMEAFRYSENDKDEDDNDDDSSQTSERGDIINKLTDFAKQVVEVYESDVTAPIGWHLKNQMKKELRQVVRRILKDTNLQGWQKEIPAKIEEYALKNFIKV